MEQNQTPPSDSEQKKARAVEMLTNLLMVVRDYLRADEVWEVVNTVYTHEESH